MIIRGLESKGLHFPLCHTSALDSDDAISSLLSIEGRGDPLIDTEGEKEVERGERGMSDEEVVLRFIDLSNRTCRVVPHVIERHRFSASHQMPSELDFMVSLLEKILSVGSIQNSFRLELSRVLMSVLTLQHLLKTTDIKRDVSKLFKERLRGFIEATIVDAQAGGSHILS